MNLPRSKLKNAFYILIALALVYVFLVNTSLNNTSKEALTPDFEKRVFDSGSNPQSESGSNRPKDVTDELRLYQVDMTNYRSDLDNRLKDLKTNPPSKDIGYTTESYTTVVWATLGTVLLFLIFTELE